MDADILRLILFLAGVGLILGIYLWDRHKKVNAKVHAIRKAQLGEAIPNRTDVIEKIAEKRLDPSWQDEDYAMETVAYYATLDNCQYHTLQ